MTAVYNVRVSENVLYIVQNFIFDWFEIVSIKHLFKFIVWFIDNLRVCKFKFIRLYIKLEITLNLLQSLLQQCI